MAIPRPTIVLLHGFPLDSRMWDRVMPRLAERFRVVAPDFPGFGGTPLLSRPFTMSNVADWVADLVLESMRDQDDDRVIVCGLSMGGYVALELADRSPHLLRAMVLCDSKTQADTDEARMARLEMSQRMRGPAGREAVGEVARSMAAKVLSPRTIDSDPEAVESFRQMVLQCDPLAIAAAQEGMAARRDTELVVRALQVPLLCVVGEDDGLTPPELMRQTAEIAPRGSFAVIPEAGHLSPLEQPERYAEAVKGFWSALQV